MALPNVRKQLLSKIEQLTDEQLESLLTYAEAMQTTAMPENYREEDDPSIGFLSGSTDLATRAKEILRDEITPLSGWTQKKD